MKTKSILLNHNLKNKKDTKETKKKNRNKKNQVFENWYLEVTFITRTHWVNVAKPAKGISRRRERIEKALKNFQQKTLLLKLFEKPSELCG